MFTLCGCCCGGEGVCGFREERTERKGLGLEMKGAQHREAKQYLHPFEVATKISAY